MARAYADGSLNLTGDLPTYLRDTSVSWFAPSKSHGLQEHECRETILLPQKKVHNTQIQTCQTHETTKSSFSLVKQIALCTSPLHSTFSVKVKTNLFVQKQKLLNIACARNKYTYFKRKKNFFSCRTYTHTKHIFDTKYFFYAFISLNRYI